MASDFDRFLSTLNLPPLQIHGSIPSQMPPTPASTPFPSVSPPQQQAIQQAASGLPASLVQMIAQAAQQAAQQRPEPIPQAQPQAPIDMTPYIEATGGDPRRMASTGPVQGPAVQAAQETKPEGYVPVVLLTPSGAPVTGEAIFVPESKAKNLPSNAKRLQDEVVTDPAAVETMRQAGRMLDQQPEDVQILFRSSEETAAIGKERGRQQGIEPDPNAIVPSTTAVRTDDQEAAVQKALGMPEQKPVLPGDQIYATSQLRASGDADLVKLADDLEASGITSIGTNQVVMIDPQSGRRYLATPEEIDEQDLPYSVDQVREIDADFAKLMDASGLTSIRPSDMQWAVEQNGKLVIIPDEQRKGMKSPDVPDDLTTEQVRRTSPALANQMEAQGVFSVPSGQMLIRNTADGSFRTVGAREDESTIPDGYEYVLWGGARPELTQRPDTPGLIDQTLEFTAPVLNALDMARQAVATGMGKIEPASSWWVEHVTSPAWRTILGDTVVDAAVENLGNSPVSLVSPLTNFQMWASQNREKVQDARENGWDAENGEHFDGDRAVWEAFINEQPKWLRVYYDVVMDPLNYTPLAGNKLIKAGSAVRGAGEVTTLARRALGTGLEKTGQALLLPDTLVDEALSPAISGLSSTLKKIPGIKQALDVPLGAKIRQGVANLNIQGVEEPAERLGDLISRERRQMGVEPPVYGPEGPIQGPLAPVTPEQVQLPSPDVPTGPVARDVADTVQGPVARDVAEDVAVRDVMRDAGEIGTRSVTTTPPLSAEDIATLPPHQQRLYESWQTTISSPEGPSVADPFKGTTLGEKPDWDFLTPKERTNLTDAIRVTDRAWELGRSQPERWRRFVEAYRERAIAFVDSERRLRDASFSTKGERKGFDYAHSQLSAVNEARHVVDDVNAAFLEAFGDVELPAYKFRNERISGRDIIGQRDDYLIEQAVFGNEKNAAEARAELGRRVETRGDEHLGYMNRVIDDLRVRYQQQMRGEWRSSPVVAETVTPGQQDIPIDLPDRQPAPKVDDAELRRKRALADLHAVAKERGISHDELSSVAKAGGRKSIANLNADELVNWTRNIVERGDDAVQSIKRIHADYTGQRAMPLETTTPDTSSPASVTALRDGEFDLRSLPVTEVRTARSMTPEQRADLGIPDFQMREADYAEQSVRDIVNNWDPNQYDPIKVVEAGDGHFYVTSGHSRLEAFRRMGKETIPVQVQHGTSDQIARASKLSNTAGTELNSIERGQAIRDLRAQGQTDEQIAQAMKQGDPSGKKPGVAEIRRYVSTSYLPDGAVKDAVLDRRIRLDMSAELGRAIEQGIMSPAEVNTFYTNVVNRQRLTPAQVRELVTSHAQMKEARGITSTALFGDADLGGTGFVASMNKRASLLKDRSALVRDRNAIERTGKKTTLSREQNDRLTSLNTKIDEIEEAMNAAREELFIDTSRPVESIGEDLLRPMTEADAGTIAARRTQRGMDVGAPEFGGRTSATPGDALSADDLLNQPERSAADAMRDSGATPLFSSADAQARYQAEQWADATKRLWRRTGGRQVANPSYVSPSVSRFIPEDHSATRYLADRVMSNEEIRALSQRFTDGDSIAERWSRYVDEIGRTKDSTGHRYTIDESEVMAAEKVMGDWSVETLRQIDPKAMATYEAKLTELTDAKIDPVAAQAQAFALALGAKGPKALQAYDTTLAVLREMALYNSLTGIRYIMTQGVGNTITALVTDNGDMIGQALNPKNVRAAYVQLGAGGNADDWVSRGLKRLAGDKTTGNLPGAILHDDADRILAELDLGGKRGDIFTVVRDEVTGDFGRPLRTEQVADRLRLGKMKIPAGKVSGVFANRHIRDLANAMDLTYRKSLYAHTMQANIAEVRSAFRAHMLDSAPLNADRAAIEHAFDDLPLVFGSDRIRLNFADIDRNYADRMARDWQNSLGKMDKNAREEVRRVFFSGEETNADRALRRVIFFHYWMSRATPLYTASLMKHPGMMNAYVKMLGYMREQAESGRYGGAVDGMLKILSTPMGYNIFIRPDAFFQTIVAWGADSDYTPEGENIIGKLLRESGLFINPLIDTIVNLTGAEGDTFAPDPLMLGQWTQLVQNALNLGKAHGIIDNDGPARNLYNDFWAQLRTHTSGTLPGTEHIPYKDSVGYARRDINYLIMDVAEEQGLDPTGPEALAAMDDPSSPLYQEAFQRFADSNGMAQLARVLPTSVLYPKFRTGRQDRIGYELNQELPGSTHRDPLYDQRTMATTTDPRARQLKQQQDEYYALGTPEQQDAYSTYNQIRYGGLDKQITINGVALSERQLRVAGPDERAKIADMWADQSGNRENIDAIRDERKTYRDTHPAYAGYVEWAGTVRDYDGGAYGYWEDLIEGNPNAARWFEGLDEPMSMDDLTSALTSMDAYMQVQGIQSTMYDPKPISVNDPQAVPYTPVPAGGSGGYPGRQAADPAQQIVEDLAQYRQDTATFDQQVSALTGDTVNLDGLNPMARRAYESNFRDAGIDVPSLPIRTRRYLEWAEAQPDGADDSPEAYVRWLESTRQSEPQVPTGATGMSLDQLMALIGQ